MADIAMTHVNSSNVKAVGHDPNAMELHVEFHSGDRYIYADVPAAVHRDLIAAPSAGRFLHANVRGKFAGRKA